MLHGPWGRALYTRAASILWGVMRHTIHARYMEGAPNITSQAASACLIERIALCNGLDFETFPTTDRNQWNKNMRAKPFSGGHALENPPKYLI